MLAAARIRGLWKASAKMSYLCRLFLIDWYNKGLLI